MGWGSRVERGQGRLVDLWTPPRDLCAMPAMNQKNSEAPSKASSPKWMTVDEFLEAQNADARRLGMLPSEESQRNLEFLARRRGLTLCLDGSDLWRPFDRFGFFTSNGELCAHLPDFSEAYQWLVRNGPVMEARFLAAELAMSIDRAPPSSRLRL